MAAAAAAVAVMVTKHESIDSLYGGYFFVVCPKHLSTA